MARHRLRDRPFGWRDAAMVITLALLLIGLVVGAVYVATLSM